MSRTIKFRLYDKGSSRFLYASWGDLHNDDVNTGREFYPLEFCVGFKGNHASELSSPMQFSGLLDKNGKEIYEGDICRNKFGTAVEVVFGNFCMGTDDWGVEHKSPCFCFKFDDGSGYVGLNSECEVIGNIYEGLK